MVKRLTISLEAELADEVAERADATSKTADPIDASVVLVAAARRHAVLTSDPDDIERIAEAAGLDLRVLRV